MTSLEMYQEFEQHVDKVDSQDLPEFYPEQIFMFLNTAVDEYVQAVRSAYEESAKLSDDAISLVKRVFIKGEVIEDRVKFDYNKATITRDSQEYQTIYYLLNSKIESTFKLKDKSYLGITEVILVQQDDVTVEDPYLGSKWANKVVCVKEDSSLIGLPNKDLQLDTLVATVILKPAIIDQTTNCDLREQIHKTIVKRAAEIALENVESARSRTFNKN